MNADGADVTIRSTDFPDDIRLVRVRCPLCDGWVVLAYLILSRAIEFIHLRPGDVNTGETEARKTFTYQQLALDSPITVASVRSPSVEWVRSPSIFAWLDNLHGYEARNAAPHPLT